MRRLFLGSAIFEVFESKLASRVVYGVGARYLFRQRVRIFTGLSGRIRKFVFLDKNGHENDKRLERGARAASALEEERVQYYVCTNLHTLADVQPMYRMPCELHTIL